MLVQCIPIVTAVGGMQKIVKNTGIVLAQENKAVLIEEINKLLALPHSNLEVMGASARSQIVSNFSIEKRAALLVSTLSEV